jgi:hypothetical protein
MNRSIVYLASRRKRVPRSKAAAPHLDSTSFAPWPIACGVSIGATTAAAIGGAYAGDIGASLKRLWDAITLKPMPFWPAERQATFSMFGNPAFWHSRSDAPTPRGERRVAKTLTGRKIFSNMVNVGTSPPRGRGEPRSLRQTPQIVWARTTRSAGSPIAAGPDPARTMPRASPNADTDVALPSQFLPIT